MGINSLGLKVLKESSAMHIETTDFRDLSRVCPII